MTHQHIVDIEELNRKYDGIISQSFAMPTEDDVRRLGPMVDNILAHKGKLSTSDFRDEKRRLSFTGKNSFLYEVYKRLAERGDVCSDEASRDIVRRFLKIKAGKSHSGVLVITVFTSAYPSYVDADSGDTVTQEFSCAWNCAYCPNEPGQPRSYLKGEPGVLRANKNGFDCVRQMHDRMSALYTIGHSVDKLEVLVLGGTWTSYPKQYREQFCRDIYYAANVFWQGAQARDPMGLEEEKLENWTAKTRVIGLTLETRPDTICGDELKLMRTYGCTRVQLGIQHLDDGVLNHINRRCTSQHVAKAIRMLKDTGFKVDGHWMPNLPGSSIEKDKMLFSRLLGVRNMLPKRWKSANGDHWEEYDLEEPDYQTDQWKIYPCAVVPWTDIEKWYKEGTYVPYEEGDLVDLLLKTKSLVFPWIRLNRIIRDIPSDYILCSSDKSNMRQELADMMRIDGTRCNCIRCREVKGRDWDGQHVVVVRKYNASGGTEYFIGAESKDNNTLYGFVRLRTCNTCIHVFPELEGCALVRELHVYGTLAPVDSSSDAQRVQHRGIGKALMERAENIARSEGYSKVAVIAAEGTKTYYEKLGYHHVGDYSIKKIELA